MHLSEKFLILRLVVICLLIFYCIKIPEETFLSKQPTRFLKEKGRNLASNGLSIPYVDTHYGNADGIIDPTEYSFKYIDTMSNVTLYMEHDGSRLYIGLSANTTGWVGMCWKDSDDDFSDGLNRSDILLGYAPGNPHEDYPRTRDTDIVEVHYVLTLRNGTAYHEGIFPTLEDGYPLQDIPSLVMYREQLYGMRIGEIRNFIVPAENAFNNPIHPLYGLDLEYTVTLTAILRAGTLYNVSPSESSLIRYSDRYGISSDQHMEDTNQDRILSANASDDTTKTQVEYAINMNSQDPNDISISDSFDVDNPFILMQSPSEAFATTTYSHTNWSEPLMLKFLPNSPPEIEITNPSNLDSLENPFRLELNITDNTLVRTAELMIDTSSWVMMDYNSSQGLWVIDINTTTYNLGLHMFRFRATDASEIVTMDEVQVRFVDFTSPVIQGHADITYFYGDIGNSIIWNCTDLRPNNYRILRNGTEIESGTWNTTRFVVNVDEFDVGVYNFTLIVYDDAGNYARDVVILTVQNAWITGTTDLLQVGIIIALGASVASIIIIRQVIKQRKKKDYQQF
jgi:hypothetical protein